jgi:hypothetical protein
MAENEQFMLVDIDKLVPIAAMPGHILRTNTAASSQFTGVRLCKSRPNR